jgi:DNA polymerase III subunit epsilon
MELSIPLKRDLVFFDVEATGLNVLRDRILQIALIKYEKKTNREERYQTLINPGIPIPEASIAIHGITPDMVRNAPTFPQIAEHLYQFIGDADLAGYNSNRFDIPMLVEEFGRAGIVLNLDNRNLLDIQQIFYKMEPRTLKAAYRFYCDKPLENAHDAMADVEATVSVFIGQLERYAGVDFEDPDGNIVPAPIIPDVKALYQFTNEQPVIDVTQKMKLLADGRIVFNFGKYEGQEVGPVLAQDKNYYNWIMDKEFSQQVKQLAKKLLKEHEAKLG